MHCPMQLGQGNGVVQEILGECEIGIISPKSLCGFPAPNNGATMTSGEP